MGLGAVPLTPFPVSRFQARGLFTLGPVAVTVTE